MSQNELQHIHLEMWFRWISHSIKELARISKSTYYTVFKKWDHWGPEGLQGKSQLASLMSIKPFSLLNKVSWHKVPTIGTVFFFLWTLKTVKSLFLKNSVFKASTFQIRRTLKTPFSSCKLTYSYLVLEDEMSHCPRSTVSSRSKVFHSFTPIFSETLV